MAALVLFVVATILVFIKSVRIALRGGDNAPAAR